jgi:hypothetical protein
VRRTPHGEGYVLSNTKSPFDPPFVKGERGDFYLRIRRRMATNPSSQVGEAYFLNLRRSPTNPSNPEPSSQTAPGMGTGSGEETRSDVSRLLELLTV